MTTKVLVEFNDVRKYFPIFGGLLKREVGQVRAVDGVDLFINQGETLGLVGESGCGKSTLGYLMLRLETPTSGKIYFQSQNILQYRRGEMRRLRQEMQVIFQDPLSSLNYRRTIGQSIEEPLIVHRPHMSKAARKEVVLGLMEEVGLHADYYDRYPHEFSGGQNQRVGIARALTLNPKLILCDEPVSALDVSVQAQVINLLKEIQKKHQLTYLFISHDLSVVKHVSDRVAVMYLGRIVEIADNQSIYRQPVHPYTRALISAPPIPDPESQSRPIILEGDVPSPADPPSGCHFHPRCPDCQPQCKQDVPRLSEFEPGHAVSCHQYSGMNK